MSGAPAGLLLWCGGFFSGFFSGSSPQNPFQSVTMLFPWSVMMRAVGRRVKATAKHTITI